MSPHVGTAQRGVGSSPPRQMEQLPVKMGDICVGCIVWLPPRKSENPAIECSKSGCCGNEELNDAGYNHPVVVLKIRQRKNSNVRGDLVCTVACVRFLEQHYCEWVLILQIGYNFQRYEIIQIPKDSSTTGSSPLLDSDHRSRDRAPRKCRLTTSISTPTTRRGKDEKTILCPIKTYLSSSSQLPPSIHLLAQPSV
jgi:hypothetical protein